MSHSNKRLQDKVIVVTGASGGIGLESARLFLQNGAKVVMGDINEKALHEAAESLSSEDIAVLAGDISEKSYNEQLAKVAVQNFGKIDGAFLNAGIEGQKSTLQDCTEENYQKVQDVNAKGTWLGVRAMAEELEKTKGSIVITSSVAGLRGMAGLFPYIMSKHAVTGLMKCAALELGPKGIHVNSIHPGPVDNRMMDSLHTQYSPDDPNAFKRTFEEKIPLGRYANNQDIASMTLFLMSDESHYLNGESFVIDGGLCAGL